MVNLASHESGHFVDDGCFFNAVLLLGLQFYCVFRFPAMSHFSLENDMSSLLRMDAPLTKGPQMRWQRKQAVENGNTSRCNESAQNISLNASASAKTPMKVANRSTNMSVNKTPGKTPGKTPTAARTPGV